MKLPSIDTLLVLALAIICLALIGAACGVKPIAMAALALVSTIVGGLLTALKSANPAQPPPSDPQSEA